MLNNAKEICDTVWSSNCYYAGRDEITTTREGDMENNTPQVGSLVQDRIGHWYRILDVQANGWRFQVDQVYETPEGFYSYGYRAILMGRSEFKFSNDN